MQSLSHWLIRSNSEFTEVVMRQVDEAKGYEPNLKEENECRVESSEYEWIWSFAEERKPLI